MIFYDHSAQNLCLNSVLRKKQKKNEGRVSTNDYVNNKNCFKTHILGKKVQSGRLRRLSPQYGLPTGPRQTTATNFFFLARQLRVDSGTKGKLCSSSSSSSSSSKGGLSCMSAR